LDVILKWFPLRVIAKVGLNNNILQTDTWEEAIHVHGWTDWNGFAYKFQDLSLNSISFMILFSKLTLEFAIECEENGQFVIWVHQKATALHIGGVKIHFPVFRFRQFSVNKAGRTRGDIVILLMV
jgi:hypothetical protein